MKILFLCKRRNDSYGNSVGLVNSAKFVINAFKKLGHHTELAIVDDSNCIDKVVTHHKPEMVIIEALWVPPEKFVELLAIPHHRRRRWVVRIHSKTPFLAQEGIAFQWILKYAENDKLIIAPNSASLTDDLKNGLGLQRIKHLPNIYDPFYTPHHHQARSWYHNAAWRRTIDIGCFGAIRPLKNTLEQAVAAIMFARRIQKELMFHVNGERVEAGGGEIVKNLRALFARGKHQLIEHKWMDHGEFVKLVETMDIGMQVSMSESFNIVAADFAYNEVPIIVSHDVEWAAAEAKANANSAESMSAKLEETWRHGPELARANKTALTHYNINAFDVWREFLS